MECWNRKARGSGCLIEVHVGTERGLLSHLWLCGMAVARGDTMCGFHTVAMNRIEALRTDGDGSVLRKEGRGGKEA